MFAAMLSSYMTVYTFKWLCTATLFSTGLISGLLPLTLVNNQHKHKADYLKQYRRDQVLSLGNMLSAGVFLGGGLLHLLPEAHNNLLLVQKQWLSSDILQTFPLSYLLCGIGFISILCLEEIVLATTTTTKPVKLDQSLHKSQILPDTNNTIINRSLSTPHHNIINDVDAKITEITHRDFLKLYYARRNLTRNIVEALASRSALTTRHSAVTPKHTYRHHNDHKHVRTDSIDSNISSAEHTDESDTDDTEISDIVHDDTPRHYRYSANMASPAFTDIRESPMYKASSRALDNDRITLNDDNNTLQQPLLNIDKQQHHNNTITYIDVQPAPAQHTSDTHHTHNHGHDIFTDASTSSASIAYILVFALSFHGVFEGIALGTQNEMSASIALFIAIFAHTPLAGIALSISMIKANMCKHSMHVFYICLLLFSLTNPIGIVTGNLLTIYLNGTVLLCVSAVFQSFSAGTFLFVSLSEIIPKELAIQHDKKLKLLLLFIGLLLMAIIKLIDVD